MTKKIKQKKLELALVAIVVVFLTMALIFLFNKKTSEKNEQYTFHSVVDTSFKKYILDANMPEAIKKIKYGLDELSIKHVDFAIQTMINLPPYKLENLFANKKLYDNYLPKYLKAEVRKICQAKRMYRGKFQFHSEWAYYKHGLILVPQSVRDYIRNTAFIDLGCYVGDSATVLSEFSPDIIYSFDISEKNLKLYEENTKDLSVKHKAFRLALSHTKKVINFVDEGTGSTNIFNGKNGSKTVSVEVDTLDDFVNKIGYKGRIGYIKADIEGDEPNMLKGAVETIKKFRPVLFISLYHNPESFFEIKPFLENLNVGYKFILRFMAFRQRHPLSEFSLVAYPRELD
jgi:FkbM family methyltransferase